MTERAKPRQLTVDQTLRFLRKLEALSSDAAKLVLMRQFGERFVESLAAAPVAGPATEEK